MSEDQKEKFFDRLPEDQEMQAFTENDGKTIPVVGRRGEKLTIKKKPGNSGKTKAIFKFGKTQGEIDISDYSSVGCGSKLKFRPI